MEGVRGLKKLVIIGATEFAEIAYYYFRGGYDVAGFTVDQEFMEDNSLLGLPVVPFEIIHEEFPPKEYHLFTAITYGQMNRVRERFYNRGKELGYNFATYISDKAFVWDNVTIGENSFIFENNTIQYNVKIGKSVILWSGNHIGHSAQIGNFCFVSSQVVVSGNSYIGDYSFLGINSSVGNNVNISANSLIGAGTVVTHDILDSGGVYVGNPIKRLNKSVFECL